MKLLVGLGNPGSEYECTRHNLGFRVLDYLAKDLGVVFRKKAVDQAQLARYEGWKTPVLLAKPLTYMNLSGRAVAGMVQRHAMVPADVVVVLDDVSLPLGSLRVRMHGGSGGHNGLSSVIEAMGTQDFPRIRMGIGTASTPQGDLTQFVLGVFTASEEEHVRHVLAPACEALEVLVNQGVHEAMNRFNKPA